MYTPTFKIDGLEGRCETTLCYGCQKSVYMFYCVQDLELNHTLKLCGTCLDELSDVPDHIPHEQALKYFRIQKRKERDEEEM